MERPYCPYECLCHVWCKDTKKEDLPCYDPYYDSEEYNEQVDAANAEQEDFLPW